MTTCLGDVSALPRCALCTRTPRTPHCGRGRPVSGSTSRENSKIDRLARKHLACAARDRARAAEPHPCAQREYEERVAIDFCTSHFRTTQEAQYCLTKLLEVRRATACHAARVPQPCQTPVPARPRPPMRWRLRSALTLCAARRGRVPSLTYDESWTTMRRSPLHTGEPACTAKGAQRAQRRRRRTGDHDAERASSVC